MATDLGCSALPKGWQRVEVPRKSGLLAGKLKSIEVVYISPNGKRFYSKPQLARYLGDSVDLTAFDYQTGRINPHLLRKSRRRGYENGRGMGRNEALIPPYRQTAYSYLAMFKQPVTIHKTQPSSKTKSDVKHGSREKPKQLFWERRLQGLRPTIKAREFNRIDMQRVIKPFFPDITDETLWRSFATAFHNASQPLTGQIGFKGTPAEKANPSVFVNPDQPLTQPLVISDDDIRRQEEKVKHARRKLQEALAQFNSL